MTHRNSSIKVSKKQEAWKYCGLVLVFLCLWQFLFLGLSYVLYPCTGTVDTSAWDTSLYPREVPRIALGLWQIPDHPKQIFILGSSQVYRGFRAHDLQTAFSDYRVYEAAVSKSNISALKDVYDLISLRTNGKVDKTVFVLGVWMGMFSDDKTVFGDGTVAKSSLQEISPRGDAIFAQLIKNGYLSTGEANKGHLNADFNTIDQWLKKNYPDDDKNVLPIIQEASYEGKNSIEIETLRYGLYKRINGKLEPVLSPTLMPFVALMFRPLYLWHDLLDIDSSFHKIWVLLKKVPSKPATDEDNKMDAGSNSQKFFLDNKGELSDQQFKKFVDLCKSITDSGAALIIVDTPLPQWHRDRVPYYRPYKAKMAAYLKDVLLSPKARYFDLSESFPDTVFTDSYHGTEAGAKLFTDRLKGLIQQSGLLENN